MKIFDIFKRKKKKEISKVEEPKEKEVEIKKEEIKPKIKKKEGEALKILIKPLTTEKTSFLSQYNQYVFEVAPEANKIEIERAFYNVYGIKPQSVNVVKIKGKEVRYGRTVGRTKDRKKAIITLKPGEKITVYEGV